jgi:hypothetical protein
MDPVDLALLLALDCSASVTYEEFGLLAGGCAAALREPAVVAGLTRGPLGGSLCALLLWSGHGAQGKRLACDVLRGGAQYTLVTPETENPWAK